MGFSFKSMVYNKNDIPGIWVICNFITYIFPFQIRFQFQFEPRGLARWQGTIVDGENTHHMRQSIHLSWESGEMLRTRWPQHIEFIFRMNQE